jgi:hypothetical protein
METLVTLWDGLASIAKFCWSVMTSKRMVRIEKHTRGQSGHLQYFVRLWNATAKNATAKATQDKIFKRVGVCMSTSHLKARQGFITTIFPPCTGFPAEGDVESMQNLGATSISGTLDVGPHGTAYAVPKGAHFACCRLFC